jgi:hypothetical protein
VGEKREQLRARALRAFQQNLLAPLFILLGLGESAAFCSPSFLHFKKGWGFCEAPRDSGVRAVNGQEKAPAFATFSARELAQAKSAKAGLHVLIAITMRE